MNRQRLGIASAILVAIMLAVAFIVGGAIPADQQLPTHWNASGEADAFSGKWTALFLPVGMTAALSLLFYFLPSLEPRRRNLDRSQGLYLWGWAAALIVCAAIELAVVSAALEWNLAVSSLILGATGIVFLLIGNQLGKSRRMYMVGIRTPWTLASEEVWIKTHRLGGKLMVAAGLLLIVAALLPLPPGLLPVLVIGVVAIAAGVPILYSFLLWRRERHAPPG